MEAFLRKTEVVKASGYTDQHLRRLEKRDLFPRRVRIGPGRVGWPQSEVAAWIAQKIADRDQGTAPPCTTPPRRPRPDDGPNGK
ncbi:MAG: AlpA family phage regulatory protein [Alphaproteobacteria bacterium]|nr:AlpA family phage regulatory protein [Alphaproteobacteria bacterium]